MKWPFLKAVSAPAQCPGWLRHSCGQGARCHGWRAALGERSRTRPVPRQGPSQGGLTPLERAWTEASGVGLSCSEGARTKPPESYRIMTGSSSCPKSPPSISGTQPRGLWQHGGQQAQGSSVRRGPGCPRALQLTNTHVGIFWAHKQQIREV